MPPLRKPLARQRRKLPLAAGTVALLAVAVGAAVGSVVGTPGSALDSSLHGEAIGGGVGVAMAVLLYIAAGPVRKPQGANARDRKAEDQSVPH
jgi:hypothetical protein